MSSLIAKGNACHQVAISSTSSKVFYLEDLVDVGVATFVDNDFLILPHDLVERETRYLKHRATIARNAVLLKTHTKKTIRLEKKTK